MDHEAVYNAWVPHGGAWSLWVRPVLFGHMPEIIGSFDVDYHKPVHWPGAWHVVGESPGGPPRQPEQPWRNTAVDWAPPVSDQVAMIVDLPAEVGVHYGLALAGQGYRPVPLYNGCPGPSELLDQSPILWALRDGAAYLAALSLPSGAPPAFLLDWRRQSLPRALQPGMLDNRWRVYPDDLPSGSLLRQRGIARVLLVQRDQIAPQADLAAIFHFWQSAGMAMEIKYLAVPGPTRPFRVPPLPRYRQWLYAVLSTLGLQRGPREGFYHIVPEPSHG